MLKDKTALYGRIAKACLAAINEQTKQGALDPNAIATVYSAIDQAFASEQALLANDLMRYREALEQISKISGSEAAEIAKHALDEPKH